MAMNRSPAHPNLFIVGAPKCGTSALYKYLSTHPKIFMSRMKEPNFFCEDLPTRQIVSLEGYLSLFRNAEEQHAIIGEASPWYLHSSVAPANIWGFNPDARVIAMVRNPIELVYSFHSQLRFNQIETEEDFEKSWRLQSRRRERPLLQYARIARLGMQIRRLLDVFPPDQVLVIIFDDFRTSTKSVYHQVLTFLDLQPDGRTEFPRINSNKRLRSRKLAEFVRCTPPVLTSIVARGKRLLGIERIGLLDGVARVNKKPVRRESLSLAFRKELAAYFRSDVALLSELVDRDLTHWTRTDSLQ